MISNSWSTHYESRGKGIRSELIKSLPYVTTGLNALDLGCGEFIETKYLLEKGFSVVAVDPEESLGLLANELMGDGFMFECLPIQNYSFPTDFFDFVCANYSLPFVSKKKMPTLFTSIYDSMKVGGIFSFQLFGKNDQRNTWRSKTSFYSGDEILKLLDTFKIVNMDEHERNMKLVNGSYNHSHIFELIVKK